MNTPSPNSHNCPRHPLVSSFMSSGWAPLSVLNDLSFTLSRDLHPLFSLQPHCVCLCAVSVCMHMCFLIMYVLICLMLMSAASILLLSVSGKKMQDFSCVDAFQLSHSSSCPSALISPSILLCSQSECTFSFSLSRLERNTNHQWQFPFVTNVSDVADVFFFLLSVLNFFFWLEVLYPVHASATPPASLWMWCTNSNMHVCINHFITASIQKPCMLWV